MVALSATEGVVLSHRPQRFSDNNQLVTQVAHGFTVGQVLKLGSGVYSLAQANTGANLGIWMVTEVLTPDVFRVAKSGFIAGLSGGTPDETWYLSSTVAGAMTNVAPTIAQPIIYWVTSTSGWLLGYPAAAAGIPISGSAPLGYNVLNFTKSGADLTVDGNTVVSGALLDIAPTTVLVTGAAGNRYVCVSSAGAVTVETIPPAEILSDTPQYSPVPLYNQSKFGYYSSVNPSLRIVGFFYFDGSQILNTYRYGNGRDRKDNFWMSTFSGVQEYTNGNRLQFLNGFDIIHGDGISCIDNGAGNTDASGFRITANRGGKLTFSFQYINYHNNGDDYFGVNKNGSPWIALVAQGGTSNYSCYHNFTFSEPVEAGDYFTFPFYVTTNGSITLHRPRITLDESL